MKIESKVSKRLGGGSLVTASVGAGGRDVSDLTTVVALAVSLRPEAPEFPAYSSASLLGALSGDVTFLSTVLDISIELITNL
jgi:hypothetical protein